MTHLANSLKFKQRFVNISCVGGQANEPNSMEEIKRFSNIPSKCRALF